MYFDTRKEIIFLARQKNLRTEIFVVVVDVEN
jgi:hypothetical protein